MSILYQVGTLTGFLAGAYRGDCTIEQLMQKGDMGLGTYNMLDGEMVVVDGICYRIDASGKAHRARLSMCTPFAMVCQFKPSITFNIADIKGLEALNTCLDEHLSTENIFYMIRIDGEMQQLHLRSESCTHSPLLPLAKVLPKLQHTLQVNDSIGTLITTKCPLYSGTITIPGYHHHYIDSQREIGGHVFDLQVKSAQVMVTPIRELEMRLISSDAFDKLNLKLDIKTALDKIE